MLKGQKQKRVPDKPITRITPVNPQDWNMAGLARNAIAVIKKAQIMEGSSRDTVMYLLINEEDRGLFTINIENRLLALFRKIYGRVLLLEFDTIQEMKRRKELLLKNRLRRAERLKEEEYQKKQNITKNEQSATLTQ